MLRPAMQTPAQKAHTENPMNALHYIGFDVHKKTISFCVKTSAGEIVEKGSLLAQPNVLRQWSGARSLPWKGALETTLLSGSINHTLKPSPWPSPISHPATLQPI